MKVRAGLVCGLETAGWTMSKIKLDSALTLDSTRENGWYYRKA